jgi:hypothetical protein
MPLHDITVPWLPDAHERAFRAIDEVRLRDSSGQLLILAGFDAYICLIASKDHDTIVLDCGYSQATFVGCDLHMVPEAPPDFIKVLGGRQSVVNHAAALERKRVPG